MKKTAVILILVMLLSFFLPCPSVSAEKNGIGREEILSLAKGIINQKSNALSSSASPLLDKLSSLSGSTSADWYAFAIGRLSLTDGRENVYTDRLRLYVERKYAEDDKLSNSLSTEWHRIALTALALGKDATAFGTDKNGQPIDLICDGTYNRELTVPLKNQGINGYIWALITLDSLRYTIPDNAKTSREDIICGILEYMLSDGGFALSGKYSDPDMTAMVITALSPYINENTVYSFTQKSSGEKREERICGVIDGALSALSKMQASDGEFSSYGSKNVKSTCQVAVALCSVGIDIFSDERFIKNGSTLFDVIMRYKNPDGGFSNLSGDTVSNSMSGEQVLYTLSAILRFFDSERKLFDLRSEFSDSMKERLRSLNEDISLLSSESDSEEVEEIYRRYASLPFDERDYIYSHSYRVLEEYAKIHSLDIDKIESETEKHADEDSTDKNTQPNEDGFTDEDRAFLLRVLADPESLTSLYYDELIILQKKLVYLENGEEKSRYILMLSDGIVRIERILEEIEYINEQVALHAYPLEAVDASKAGILSELVKRYESLSEYDRTKIDDSEGLYTAHAKAITEARAQMIFYISAGAVLLLTVIIIFRIRVRKKRKQAEED